jgi:hypothetical protein
MAIAIGARMLMIAVMMMRLGKLLKKVVYLMGRAVN